jgi:hypothetical protein
MSTTALKGLPYNFIRASGSVLTYVLPGLHLWIEPISGIEAEQCRKTITQLASQQKSPIFPPHITLYPAISSYLTLPDVELHVRRALAKVRGVTSDKEIEIKLNNPQMGDKYYQCVLAPVVEGNKHLLAIRQACEEEFGEVEGEFSHI